MAAPIGWGNRAHETTQTEGTNPYLIDIGSADNNMVSLVVAVKQISGVGTGPWLVEYIVSDDNDFEIGKSTLEEGTGGGGEDRLMRDGSIYDSSNGGSAVSWGVGTRDVILAPSSAKMAALTDKLTTNGFIERTGDDVYAIQSIGAKGRDLVATATAATGRSTLGSTTVGDAVFIAATVAAARTALDFAVGLLSARPSAGTAGRVYLTTDTPSQLFLDTGSVWTLIASSDLLRTTDEGHGNGIDADTIDTLHRADLLTWDSADYYNSGDPGTAIAANTAYSFAHGFGQIPRLWQLYLRCNTTNLGYAVDDEILIGSDMFGEYNHGLTPFVDSDYIRVRVNGSLKAINSSFVRTSITLGSWRLKARAWK